jgi:hypothetical protein
MSACPNLTARIPNCAGSEATRRASAVDRSWPPSRHVSRKCEENSAISFSCRADSMNTLSEKVKSILVGSTCPRSRSATSRTAASEARKTGRTNRAR